MSNPTFDSRWVLDSDTGCWLWIGRIMPNGYGKFGKWRKGQTMLAHRLSYERVHGPIPSGLLLDHLCRVRHCVNPEHLEPVSHKENVRRGNAGKAQRQRTHCPSRHEYTPENTYISQNPRGGSRRHCKACLTGRRS